jgi:hypothetical protein
MSRWIAFFIAILIGAALGLLYGWQINPVEYVDTIPNSLRIDFKSDYVLMTAESYQADQDLPAAIRRLSFLGADDPTEIVKQALLFAEKQGYSDVDLATIRSLEESLQGMNPALGVP